MGRRQRRRCAPPSPSTVFRRPADRAGHRRPQILRLAKEIKGRLELPPRVRDLEIDYTALSLAAPEKVLFRYRLEGRDHEWQEVGNRRQAFYSDLVSRTVPLSRERLQQQRRVERCRSIPGFQYRAGVLPDHLVCCLLRGRHSRYCSRRCIACGCGRWSGNSTCVWKSASPSAPASRRNCTIPSAGFPERIHAGACCRRLSAGRVQGQAHAYAGAANDAPGDR